jgi:hypothetical protein
MGLELMNLQRSRCHSSFIGFKDFAGQKSIASPVVDVGGWVVAGG